MTKQNTEISAKELKSIREENKKIYASLVLPTMSDLADKLVIACRDQDSSEIKRLYSTIIYQSEHALIMALEFLPVDQRAELADDLVRSALTIANLDSNEKGLFQKHGIGPMDLRIDNNKKDLNG